MTMTITNLPRDLVEEILSRFPVKFPVKSIGAVRSTCKNWNFLSKDERFANKHIDKAAASALREKEYLMITGVSRGCLRNVNLYETHKKNFGLSINPKAICIAREHSDQTLYLSQVFVSNGLLLCIWRTMINNRSRLLVWNPYWGKRRWIECPTYCWDEKFAFGYVKSCGSHKILRLRSNKSDRHMDIYDVSSDSWRTLDATFERYVILFIEHGLSLKGNTYFESHDRFLHCFDFTRERFGPGLPLPLHPSNSTVSLSSIKEEKLAVLVSLWDTFEADIWITDKIDPYTGSWSKFLKVETTPDIDHYFRCGGHFFTDEERKVIVVFSTYDNAYYISGESGHLRKVYPRASSNKQPYRLVGCYLPSSVQI